MKWPWEGRMQAMREDAETALATSHRQYETASQARQEATIIGSKLREIREMNHLAAAVLRELKGA